LTLALHGVKEIYAPAALPRGNSTRYPVKRKTDGLHSQFGRRGVETSFVPTGNRTPTDMPIAIPTELSRLLRSIKAKKIKSYVNTTQRRKEWRKGDGINITNSERKGESKGKRKTEESEREKGILRRRSHNRGN
jgi:hypothetical protein